MLRTSPPCQALLLTPTLCLLGAAFLLHGCGGEPPATTTTALPLSAPPPPPADSMHVYDSTLTRLAADFTDNVYLDTGIAVLGTDQELPWSTLAAAAPTDRGLHGLLVDYGLNGDSLRYGFRFVTLVPDSAPATYSWTAPDSLYDLNNKALDPELASDWQSLYQVNEGSSTPYFSRVRIRHKPGDPFSPVDPGTDAHADLMAWEHEVLAMHDENASGHGDSTLHLVIRPIARYDVNGALRHHTAYHMRLRPATGTGYRDLLDNSFDGRSLFRSHGCDFGTICPPNCATYTEPVR